MDLEKAEHVLQNHGKLLKHNSLSPDPTAGDILISLADEARAHRLGSAGQGPILNEVEVEEELARLLQGHCYIASSLIEAVAAILAAKEDEETAKVLAQED